jgi:hypothetical protein
MVPVPTATKAARVPTAAASKQTKDSQTTAPPKEKSGCQIDVRGAGVAWGLLIAAGGLLLIRRR